MRTALTVAAALLLLSFAASLGVIAAALLDREDTGATGFYLTATLACALGAVAAFCVALLLRCC